MGFKKIRDLARSGYLPKVVAKAQQVKCPAYQQGKTFGCPVYILNDNLQNSKGQPKWLPRSRVGVHLGKSRDHTSSVYYVLNLKNGNNSLQYHCV